MERVNWSSVVQGIQGSRSGRALFFKPACVIAAIDLIEEGKMEPDALDAAAILDRFYDYIAPVLPDRASEGHQPLWALSNNHLWTFFEGDRRLGPKDFRHGRPSTKKMLIERFDRLAVHEGVKRLWEGAEHRRSLRDQMLLMLYESDQDSRKLAHALFDPRHVTDPDRWPSNEKLQAYFAPLRQPSLFDEVRADVEPSLELAQELSDPTLSEKPDKAVAPVAVEDVPSAIDYVWQDGRVVVGPDLASVPSFPSAGSRRDHAIRLEVCIVQARDLAADLDRRRWQVREDYKLQIDRYIDRLPRDEGSGNILLADGTVRIIRDLFAAEQSILPLPFAAGLKALLQHHAALRPFYPEVESYYRAVRTGRIEETLPLDAVESIFAVVREQTPMLFGESVSAALNEASARENVPASIEGDGGRVDETISPPPDPLGSLDPKKAHDFQIAGVLNRLWKVFTSSEKIHSSLSGWTKTYNELSGPVTEIVRWLRSFLP